MAGEKTKYETKVDRTTDVDLIVTRQVNGPAHLVFQAWTRPDLMVKWWTPASFGITFVTCEIDARTGGSYKFVFTHPAFEGEMAFFGRYIEVVPNEKLVWTNAETEDGAVSTLTFVEKDGVTTLRLHEVYPTKAALDEEIEQGAVGGYPEQFEGLDTLLAGMARA